jgi:hypothetical protein
MAMISAKSGAASVTAITLLALSMLIPAASGATSGYLTTGVTQSAIKQATINNYKGVLVNYTSTYSTPLGAFVYLDVVNSAGQTVSWSVGYCSFGAGQKVQCFVTISPTVQTGNYTAWVFATTNSSIPISTFNSVKVTI